MVSLRWKKYYGITFFGPGTMVTGLYTVHVLWSVWGPCYVNVIMIPSGWIIANAEHTTNKKETQHTWYRNKQFLHNKVLYSPKKCRKGTKRKKWSCISKGFARFTIVEVENRVECVSLLQSIYTKIRSMILPSPMHPANRDMSASVGKLELTVNLAERTSVKGSDRVKSRKPGNVKSQKSAEALKSESPPAEASLSSLPTQGTSQTYWASVDPFTSFNREQIALGFFITDQFKSIRPETDSTQVQHKQDQFHASLHSEMCPNAIHDIVDRHQSKSSSSMVSYRRELSNLKLADMFISYSEWNTRVQLIFIIFY